MMYAGADWIKRSLKVDNMSAVGEAAADLLGDIYLGIYHLSTRQLMKVSWENKHCIEMVVSGSMSTYDDNILTRIVTLAHDRMMRVEVIPHGFGYLRLLITQRKSRDGDTFDRCPTLEYHVAFLRKHYSPEGKQTFPHVPLVEALQESKP